MNNIIHIVRTALLDLLSRSRAEEMVVSLSGGRDSIALLQIVSDLMSELDVKVRAIHIDHGLTADSNRVAAKCAVFCRRRKVPIEVHRLKDSPRKGESVEKWARRERYAHICSRIGTKSLVLTAHHVNDHVETIIQRFLKGSGPHGLRGILTLRALGPGYLGRPLLTVQRSDITNFVISEKLEWFDDPMNEDLRFERNLVRKKVVPELESISESLVPRLVNLSRIQGEVAEILDGIADSRLTKVSKDLNRISIEVLRESDAFLRPFILKRAMVNAGLPIPREKKIETILDQMLNSKTDSLPFVKVGDYDLRRYESYIYMMRSVREEFFSTDEHRWDTRRIAKFPWGNLQAEREKCSGIDINDIDGKLVTVRFRLGGERFHPSDRNRSNQLKKLFQEWRIPPWERFLTPLIYVDGELAAVGSIAIAKKFKNEDNRHGKVTFKWDLLIYK